MAGILCPFPEAVAKFSSHGEAPLTHNSRQGKETANREAGTGFGQLRADFRLWMSQMLPDDELPWEPRFRHLQDETMQNYSDDSAFSAATESSFDACDLKHYRAHLRQKAAAVPPHIRVRQDASDLVQITLLDAHRKRSQFRGQNQAQMRAWLDRILSTKLADALTMAHRLKRNVARERSIDQLDESRVSSEPAFMAASEDSPSTRLNSKEQTALLWAAVARLTDGQRLAIELHYGQSKTLAETAIAMNLSRTAAAGLISRGLKKLRDVLQP